MIQNFNEPRTPRSPTLILFARELSLAYRKDR